MPFDVFVSYNSRDEQIVRRLVECLKNAGIKPWFDREQIRAGDIILERLAVGLKESPVIAIAVGREGFGPHQTEEGYVAVQSSIHSGTRVIPVLLPAAGKPDPTTLPPFLQIRRFVALGALDTADVGFDELVRGQAPPLNPRRQSRRHLRRSRTPRFATSSTRSDVTDRSPSLPAPAQRRHRDPTRSHGSC